MTQTYDLCLHDLQIVTQNQLATTDFADQVNYDPYKQWNPDGEPTFSNLMSGNWAWRQAVCFPFSVVLTY
jgi:hypothetical protein